VKFTLQDIESALRNRWPLSEEYHIRRLRELFAWVGFSGELRPMRCAVSDAEIWTNLPMSLDSRIVSQEAYLKMLD
jgi:hypothetical protein